MAEKQKQLLIPNSTQIPNILLDFVIPELPPAESKCLLYICRCTFGFHKEYDRISLSQFIKGKKGKDGKQQDKGAGVARSSAVLALKNLTEANAIIAYFTPRGMHWKINLDMDPEEVVQKVNRFRKLTRSGSETEPKVVQKLNLQNKEKQRETKICARKAAHVRMMTFFYEKVQAIRGFKPKFGPKDGKMLKDVLALGDVPETRLEQMIVYFLAHPNFAKFSPTPSTFFSAGIFTGILNRMANDPAFWKDLEKYSQGCLGRPAETEGLSEQIKALARKLNLNK